MKTLSLDKKLYAILSGVLLTASFPPGKLEWISWLALVPLLMSIKEQSRSNAFKLGVMAGIAHYLTLIYWIIVVLHTYGGLDYFTSLVALILLSLYLSIYLGLFSLLFTQIRDSRFPVILAASSWVVLEYIRAQFMTGFPWCLLGYCQYKHPILIQIVDLVGVYGISFLIVAMNVLLYFMLCDTRLSVQKKWLRSDTAIGLAIIIGTILYGQYRLHNPYANLGQDTPIRAAIVQGNIDQSLKWDVSFQAQTIDSYQRLTQVTSKCKPDLVVWPETSVPLFFQNKTALSDKVVQIAKNVKASLLFGSPAYERHNGTVEYFNRAYLLSPNGEVDGYYDKVHLVPFGEYVPLKRFLPFIHRLVHAAGDFTAGQKQTPLRNQTISAGILICFEGIFPELSRSQSLNGATILVNITNDAWYGMTSAPHQLLMMSALRAVENRRWLIRSANTGISAFIDPYGRITQRSSLFIESTLTQSIQASSLSTFYTQYGDLFVMISLIIGLIYFFRRLCYYFFLTKD